MKSTETLLNTHTETIEQKGENTTDVFDTAAVEMGHYALIGELYATEDRIAELTTTTSESRDEIKDTLDSQDGGPQATRNRMIGLQFQTERAQRERDALEQKKRGIEAVFETPTVVEVDYTASFTEIPVLRRSASSNTEHFDRAA